MDVTILKLLLTGLLEILNYKKTNIVVYTSKYVITVYWILFLSNIFY